MKQNRITLKIHFLHVLYIFVSYKPFGQLLDISPKLFMFLENLTQNFHIMKCSLQIKISNLLEIER